ncbi:hypothetical protein [Gordonia sp. NPDC003585]|uniref:hypothetical protein n=1 Tax=Gordonia sp. NPDC003585 TaxID=3154275 RepID=UPI00339EA884
MRFKIHRQYEARKDAANNAVMGLLAGAQLSAHFLQPTLGSERMLPEIFPNVEHIKRFNLRSESAAEILSAADAHLGMMSVPYVLSLHEDYLRTCAKMLHKAGRCSATKAKANLNELHQNIADASGAAYTIDMIAYIDALRWMRNDVIHNGGIVRQQLIDAVRGWTQPLTDGWVALARRDPTALSVGDRIEFGHGEMVAVLAVTKRLDRETNVMLQAALPRTTWVSMVVDEADELVPGGCGKDPILGLRKAKGVARHHYASVGLTEAEIKAEIALR